MTTQKSNNDKTKLQWLANRSLFANSSQIDLSRIYLLTFRSQIDSYTYLPQFHFMNIIPIRQYINLTNIIPIHKYKNIRVKKKKFLEIF